MRRETAVIIGAGPAGLTAAYELLTRAGIRPIVFEKTPYLGGLSRTARFRGNRMDLGGHRFFSKSDRVMQWWLEQMPLQALPDQPVPGALAASGTEIHPATNCDPERCDHVMLLRQRRSRIYYRRRFFEYPIRPSFDTFWKLGLWQTCRIAASYGRSALWPIRPERTLEHFFINRFGRELYRTFFQSYTEKVWGVPCSQISAEWGAQRVKGLSIKTAILHALAKPFQRRSLAQKTTETSLIEQFLYPKYGPGQLWEHVARRIQSLGGEVLTEMEVQAIDVAGRRVLGVDVMDLQSGDRHYFPADYCFSTMPVKDLVRSLSVAAPQTVQAVSEGLLYRDFLTIGMLADELKVRERSGGRLGPIRDNWIYIQEPDVMMGRMQLFNNWSPYLVADPSKTWVGLEYFCNEHDELWNQRDGQLAALAADELARIGILDPRAILEATVIRVPKAYPAYFGTYDRFEELRAWLDRFENLFLIGRNGMHRYNNMDHSMLTAMVAVDNILSGRTDKSNIWAVNTEAEYHETRSQPPAEKPHAPPEEEPLSETSQPDAVTAEACAAGR